MKYQFAVSVMLGVGITAYGALMQFLPNKQQISRLKMQNQSLQLQVSRLELSTPKQPNLTVDHFYTWFAGQHVAGIDLVGVASNPQGIHMQLAGTILDTVKFLNTLAASQLQSFSMVRNGESFNVNIDFMNLIVEDTPIPTVAEAVKPIIKNSPVQTTTMLGHVRKQGKSFCVFESEEKIVLQQGDRC